MLNLLETWEKWDRLSFESLLCSESCKLQAAFGVKLIISTLYVGVLMPLVKPLGSVLWLGHLLELASWRRSFYLVELILDLLPA